MHRCITHGFVCVMNLITVSQIVSDIRSMIVTALEPADSIEIDHIPDKLSRDYLVSSWIPPLTEKILSLHQESTLVPVFSLLFHHLSSMETEALSEPRKAAIFLNNCIYMANRFSLHLGISSNHIIMLKQRGTSLFLRYVNEHKVPEVAVSLPVSSSLKIFLCHIGSLAAMESAWKQSLPFENYSKTTALLFNALSIAIESYVFQQKFLTEFEVGLLKSLVGRAIQLAESWCRASQKPLQVSPVKLSHLLRLLTMNSEDITLAWRSQIKPLSNIFTSEQVTSLARARFPLKECDILHSVLI